MNDPRVEHGDPGLYVHVPFCARRCGYCNFSVLAGRNDLVPRFLAALERDLSELPQLPVASRFVGGGTPTQLPAADLRRFLDRLRERFPFREGAGEWTVEANPDDLDDATLDALQDAGVNRLSIGVQSFHDATLRVLERDHDGETAVAAVRNARRRWSNVSIDLIFAVPGQEVRAWRDDLDRAMDLGVTHVSTYGLTVERGTMFWNRRYHGSLREVPDELQLEMYGEAIERLTRAGLHQYEVSSFAAEAQTCRHNIGYWTMRPFLAAGPGAAAFDGRERTVRHRSPTTWLRRIESGESPVVEREALAPEELALDRLVFGMRLLRGVCREEFELRTGRRLEQVAGPRLERLVSEGWLAWSGTRLHLTRAGLPISDALWPQLGP